MKLIKNCIITGPCGYDGVMTGFAITGASDFVTPYPSASFEHCLFDCNTYITPLSFTYFESTMICHLYGTINPSYTPNNDAVSGIYTLCDYC